MATAGKITIRRTRTTIQSREVYRIRMAGQSIASVCADCVEPVRMISLDESVDVSGASSRMIHQWIEGHSIHFIETPGGRVLICPSSLLRAASELQVARSGAEKAHLARSLLSKPSKREP